jgi:hypothetical protein
VSDLTDTVKLFADYAKSQGSKSYSRYFSNVTKACNKATGARSKSEMTDQQLSILDKAEIIAKNAIEEGMSLAMPYKSVFKLIAPALEAQLS